MSKILPCAVNLNGKYDMERIFVDPPVKLGRGRIERLVGIKFTPEEQAVFDKSTGTVRKLVEKLKP